MSSSPSPGMLSTLKDHCVLHRTNKYSWIGSSWAFHKKLDLTPGDVRQHAHSRQSSTTRAVWVSQSHETVVHAPREHRTLSGYSRSRFHSSRCHSRSCTCSTQCKASFNLPLTFPLTPSVQPSIPPFILFPIPFFDISPLVATKHNLVFILSPLFKLMFIQIIYKKRLHYATVNLSHKI